MLSSLIILVLMFVGFVGVGWVINTVFGIFRKTDEIGRFDPLVALILWVGLFGTYSYIVANVLR